MNIEENLGGWLVLVDHEARKQLKVSSDLRSLLVSASHHLTACKRALREGNEAYAKELLAQTAGLIIGGAAKELPHPALGLVGLVHEGKLYQASRN